MIEAALLFSLVATGALQDPSPPTPERLPTTNLADLRSREFDWIDPPLPPFPVEALNAGTTAGMVRITCRSANPEGVLSNCEVVTESPAGQGFGAAALAAMPQGRVRPHMVQVVAERGSLTFTSQFLAPDDVRRDAQGRVPADTHPEMRRGTTIYSFETRADPGPIVWDIPPRPYFPDRAHNRGIFEGVAVVICHSVSTDRVLSRCAVVEETPPNVGFGPAVLNAIPGARVSEAGALSIRENGSGAFAIRFGAR